MGSGLRRWLAVGAAAVLAAGCRARPAATPAPPAPPAPAQTRVGVVDLEAAARAHPLWPELEEVRRQQALVEAQLARLLPPAVVPVADLQRALDEEARRLQADLEREMRLLQQDAQRRLEAFAEAVRRDQQTRLEALRAQLEEDAARTLEARQRQLQEEFRRTEQAIRDEYRYPLLNLRLRAEVAGLRSEDEAQELQRQAQALQQEREERIQAAAAEADRAFADFRRTVEADVNARLAQAQEQLAADARRRLQAREQELQAALAREGERRQRQLHDRLEARRQQLLQAARLQQERAERAYRAQAEQLRSQLLALRERRARLEDSIVADVKVEVAVVAQSRRLDVVLTRYIANLSADDLTADVAARLK
jgi:DNA repair exonuclease SbcCD ATPase subunit